MKNRKYIAAFIISLFLHLTLFGQSPDNTEILLIKWAMTVDNAEGSAGGNWWEPWEHGPIGNLHIRLYNPAIPCFGEQTDYPAGYSTDMVLPGPTENEWDDGDYREWEPYGYYLWDWTLDNIKVFLYESDQHYGTGLRKHDPVFCSNISTSSFNPYDRIIRAGPYYANDDAIARAWQRRPDNMNMLLDILQDEWPEEYTRIQSGGRFYKMYIGFKHTGAPAVPFVQQTISFEPGWNLISFETPLPGQKLNDLLVPHLNSGKIDRVLDQEGRLITWLPLPAPTGAWMDSIGFVNPTQDYAVRATQPCSIQVEGLRVESPLEVPLHEGWNILAYGMQYPRLATTVVQPLIDAGVLYKVIDEDGNELKYLAGMWVNTIGYFAPGKAYYIKVTDDVLLMVE